jgi:hypothetical protein
MLQHKRTGLLYTITLENHLKYIYFNNKNVIVNGYVVFVLFYSALSTVVFM